MELSRLLDGDLAHSTRIAPAGATVDAKSPRLGLEDASDGSNDEDPADSGCVLSIVPNSGDQPAMTSSSLSSFPPKQVIFEYLLTESTQQRARLPLRVKIYPHDATDSIISTVKNFYGLYDGNVGVSFEDKDGNTLIARYENFLDKMVVYVRVVDDIGSNADTPRQSMSPKRLRLGPAFEPHTSAGAGQSISRPSSRSARKRSNSPQHNGCRRSTSVSTNPRSRRRMNGMARIGSVQGDGYGELTMENSDSEGGNASVASSRRGKADVVASAEISVDNIVEGSRRKRARFDSSELPLFVPSQVPMTTSVSSVSPQRRLDSHAASPFQIGHQQPMRYSTALPSPQSYGNSDLRRRNGLTGGSSGNNDRARPAGRHSISGPGGVLLPTPDPTVGSVISDEDVALQLMRLGDASNFSTQGRTSTSTVDDALSGKAELASSGEESDDASVSGFEDTAQRAELVPLPFGDRYGDFGDEKDRDIKGGLMEGISKPPRKVRSGQKISKTNKGRSGAVRTKVKGPNEAPTLFPADPHPPLGPGLNVQHLQFRPQLADDEEDLSTKPRCQRCRKSKKGCDRQRPCGRCKDAGIGIEGCISEDEGNGRKGRYGRHMGVPIKMASVSSHHDGHLHDLNGQTAMPLNISMAPPPPVGDKSKKRKR